MNEIDSLQLINSPEDNPDIVWVKTNINQSTNSVGEIVNNKDQTKEIRKDTDHQKDQTVIAQTKIDNREEKEGDEDSTNYDQS
mmetsp:Transcript_22293/g.24801  ORF Transcript_22293/g.24801 Transcript_22293/m.24801 type:complete len:83 (+) Transcript_22293:24-272(+)